MRTIVGLFDSFASAQSVVRDLEASGFNRSDINVIAPGEAIGHGRSEGTATGAGIAIGAGLGLLAGLSIVAVPGVGAIAAVGPILASGLMGAVAGGLVGSLMDAGVPSEEAEYYTEGVRRGGTLVMLAARDEDAPRAVEIIFRHNPVDLNERVLQWKQSGWTPGAASTSSAPVAPAAVDETSTTPPAPAVGPNEPDPTGHTTMGDAAAAMPAPTMAIPAPGIQPTREIGANAGQENPSTASFGVALFNQMEGDFRDDFDRHFPGGSYQWDEAAPAYRCGCEVACECKEDADWSAIEPEARRRWERDHPGTWDRIKEAAHYAYDRARQRI